MKNHFACILVICGATAAMPVVSAAPLGSCANAFAGAGGTGPSVTIFTDGCFSSTTPVPYQPDGKTVNASNPEGPGYTWSFSGNTDPFITWIFAATTPGHYHVQFFLPVVGGPYGQLTNVATLSLSDSGAASANGSSVTGVSIRGEVPGGTDIAGVTLIGDQTTPAGTTTPSDYLQKMVSQSFGSPASMAVVLDFTLVSLDNDGRAQFGGTLELTGSTVPEPTAFSLLGVGLLALGALARVRTRTIR